MASSWERSRSIPWSKIRQYNLRGIGEPLENPNRPKEADDPEAEKDRIFRELRQEAAEEAGISSSDSTTTTGSPEHTSAAPIKGKKNTWSHSIFGDDRLGLFSWTDVGRHVAFGACVGTITGSLFGFMDSLRMAGESPVLQKASNAAKGTFILQGTTRSATTFGLFFGGFHLLKYGIRMVGHSPGEYTEISMAGLISLGGLFVRPTTRASVPYGAMLIAMDTFNIYVRDNMSSSSSDD